MKPGQRVRALYNGKTILGTVKQIVNVTIIIQTDEGGLVGLHEANVKPVFEPGQRVVVVGEGGNEYAGKIIGLVPSSSTYVVHLDNGTDVLMNAHWIRPEVLEPSDWEPWKIFKDINCELPIEGPPCSKCAFWKPLTMYMSTSQEIKFDGVRLCHSENMERDFSCFRKRTK